MKLRLWAILLLCALPAQAHEIWLEPQTFLLAPDATGVQVQFRLSDGKEVREAQLKPEHLLRFELVTGALHQLLKLTPGDIPTADVSLPPGPPAQSLIVMQTEPRHTNLAAPQFLIYLRDQGLTSIIEERRRRGESDRTAREDYMRCMKTLITPDKKLPPWDEPQGCPYEIVLRRLVSRTHTFEVIRHGDALAGSQQIRFTNLDTGKVYRTVRTDRNGKVTLPLPPGRWLATSVAMRRSSELQSDWRSDWASLTWQAFGKK